jgi:hypothetical protein
MRAAREAGTRAPPSVDSARWIGEPELGRARAGVPPVMPDGRQPLATPPPVFLGSPHFR